jgi:hypothetical protein
MSLDDARDLLDRSGIVRDVCDLDVLVFFARHPHTLLSSEQLALLLGYDIKRLAGSLDVLLDSGIVRRSPTSTHAARMYQFAIGAGDGWLPALLRLASSRPGRLALIHVMKSRAVSRHHNTAGPRDTATHPAAGARRPVLVARPESNARRRGGGDDDQ